MFCSSETANVVDGEVSKLTTQSKRLTEETRVKFHLEANPDFHGHVLLDYSVFVGWGAVLFRYLLDVCGCGSDHLV